MPATSTIEIPRWQDFARDVDESDAPDLYNKIAFLFLPTLGRTGFPVSLRAGRLAEVGIFSGSAWGASEYGDVIVHDAGTDQVDISLDSGRDIPTDDVTFAVLYRKTDTTDRATLVFGCNAAGAGRGQANIPWSDGVVYLTHGTAISRPTFAWTSDADWHVWHFTCGPGGGFSAGNIWLDGVNVANGNAVVRAASSVNFLLGNNPANSAPSDLAETAGLIIFNEELSAEAIRMHAADFLAPLRVRQRLSRGFVPAVAAGWGPLLSGHRNKLVVA